MLVAGKPKLGFLGAHSHVALFRKRSAGITEHEVAGEVLVLDVDSGQIHQLNVTATYVWRKCDEVESREELAAAFAAKFSIEYKQALHDVSETVATLQQLNLVTPGSN
jgi:coenzyme PQQ synthesis protein D (PqqD)